MVLEAPGLQRPWGLSWTWEVRRNRARPARERALEQKIAALTQEAKVTRVAAERTAKIKVKELEQTPYLYGSFKI